VAAPSKPLLCVCAGPVVVPASAVRDADYPGWRRRQRVRHMGANQTLLHIILQKKSFNQKLEAVNFATQHNLYL
jgi:hypothetical protein